MVHDGFLLFCRLAASDVTSLDVVDEVSVDESLALAVSSRHGHLTSSSSAAGFLPPNPESSFTSTAVKFVVAILVLQYLLHWSIVSRCLSLSLSLSLYLLLDALVSRRIALITPPQNFGVIFVPLRAAMRDESTIYIRGLQQFIEIRHQRQ